MKASLPYKYITAVKNSKQYVVFDFKDDNGKRKRKWVTTGLSDKCTKKALKEAVEKIVEDFDLNFRMGKAAVTSTHKGITAAKEPYAVMADTPESEMKMKEYMDEYLKAVRSNLARTTLQNYKRSNLAFVNYLDEHYPDITLGELRHNHVQEFLNHKLSEGCKGSCIKQYYLAIHSALAYAVKMEYLPMHPMDKLTMPRADKYEATFYNKDELNTLFEAFKDDPLELVVHIAAYYGLRRSEVIGLKWDAIDFTNKTISIQRKVVVDYDENGERKLFVENRLKTNSTRRTLPLIPHIEKMLLEKKELEYHFKKICWKCYDKEFEGFICRDNYGKMLSPDYVTARFHYIITKKGLRHLRFHDLRHSCASLLLANDIPMKAIQEWLGHSNYAITTNLYSHLEYNAKVISAETIARVLGGEPEHHNEPAVEPVKPDKQTENDPADKSAPQKSRGRKKKGEKPTDTIGS